MVHLDTLQLELLFSQFFLICEVIEIEDIQKLIYIPSRHNPEALSFVWHIWGARERMFCVFKWAWKFFHCRWEAETQSKFRKEESELNAALGGVPGSLRHVPRSPEAWRAAGGACRVQAGGHVESRSEPRALPQGRVVVCRHLVLLSWLLAGFSASPLLAFGGRSLFVGSCAVHWAMISSIPASTRRMPVAPPVVVMTTKPTPGLARVS